MKMSKQEEGRREDGEVLFTEHLLFTNHIVK